MPRHYQRRQIVVPMRWHYPTTRTYFQSCEKASLAPHDVQSRRCSLLMGMVPQWFGFLDSLPAAPQCGHRIIDSGGGVTSIRSTGIGAVGSIALDAASAILLLGRFTIDSD